MKFRYKIMAAAIIAANTASVNADLMYMNAGQDIDTPLNAILPIFANDLNPVTAFYGFTNFNPNATSVYTERTGGTDGILKNGEVLDFTDDGTVNVSSLNDLVGTLNSSTSSLEGFNTTWDFDLNYSIQGYSTASIGADINMNTVVAGTQFATNEGLIPTFTGGTLKFFYNQISANPALVIPGLATGNQVLEMKLVNGSPEIANLNLDGYVDYSGAWFSALSPAGQTAVKNLFSFKDPVNGLTTFYDIWKAGNDQLPPVATVLWNVDTNVEPNLIPSSPISNHPTGLTPGTCPAGTFCRTTNLNLDVEFSSKVPEPETILLLGIGLAGWGFSMVRRGKRKQLAA